MTTNEQQQQSQPDATSRGDEQAAAGSDQQEPNSEEAVDEEQKSAKQDRENDASLKPANGQAAAPAPAPNQEPKEEAKPTEGGSIPEAPSEHLEALRKFSVVSFREVCELYEIDLEKGERDRQVIRRRPPVYQSVRYYIMLLVLVSPFVTTYSRTIINFAITDMIDPRFTQRQAEIKQPTDLSPNATKLLAFDMDNSCPIDEPTRQRLIEEDSKDTQRAQTTQGEKFEWDTVSQGLLKGAYSYGHAFFQIPGSRLSEIYGSRLIIGTNALLIGLCCLAAPLLASLHFNLIFVDLMLLGILGSFMTPAAITLISNWLTPGEKTLMMSFILVGSRLGYALSAYLCGQLLQAGISWRYVFYSSGWLGLSFGVVFFLLARSQPKDHPLVGQLELDYLATKNTLVRESLRPAAAPPPPTVAEQQKLELKQIGGDENTNNGSNSNGLDEESVEASKADSKKRNKTAGAPWLALATSTPVWAFVVTKFCVKLAGDTAQIELPSYLKRVMHYTAADNGKVNAWNYIIFCVGCICVGTMAKHVTKRRPFGLSKTALRKMFQCVASFGVGLVLMGIAFSVCDSQSTQLLLMLFFLITTFGMGGEAQNPLDLSERYSGTIHAIGSSLAISGAIEPTLVGYFLRGRSADKDQWRYVWLGASAVSFIGGLVFLLFGDAEIQPFDRIGREHEASNPEVVNEIPFDPTSDDQPKEEQSEEEAKNRPEDAQTTQAQ